MSKMNAEQEKNRQWCYDLKKENLELKNNISEQKTTISVLNLTYLASNYRIREIKTNPIEEAFTKNGEKNSR